MFAEKDVKRDVKTILRGVYPWLANVDIKKGHALFSQLGITDENLEYLKQPFQNIFKIEVRKKEIKSCYDVEDLIDLILEKLHQRDAAYYAAQAAVQAQQMANSPTALMFCMAAKMAKADGAVSREELAFMEDFMINTLEMDSADRSTIMKYWTEAKNDSYSFEHYCNNYYNQSDKDPELLYVVLRILFELAASDKKLHPQEERMLKYAADKFELSQYFEDFKEQYFPSTDKYYSMLDCRKTDTNEQIKSSYRRLAAELHPDKFASKGLPAEMIEYAKKRLQEINEAYEIVRRERGIN